MASMNEPASNTASSHTQQSQAEARATSSMPDINQLSLGHNPDIFTIICCNDIFQLALDHSTIKVLLRVCKRVRFLLSSKLPRFHSWCQSIELLNPDGQLRIGLSPSDKIAISLHCDDQDTADRSWLEAQADQGNAAASYLLARILRADLDKQLSVRTEHQAIKQQIFQHLKKAAADNNHAMAQFHLTECYRNGTGVSQDHTKVVQLYRSLAEREMPQAQVALGGCYESGKGVHQDFDTAIEWYTKAANQGSEDGRLHIVFLRGWLSFIGHDVEQSDVDAFNHWQEVSNQSTNPVLKPIAAHMVGWMHYLGRGTMRDEQRGITIIRENRSAEFKLGEDESLAALLIDIKSKSPIACKFFNLCHLGSEHDWLCRHLMAVCLFYGFGTTKDWKNAASNFEQLAIEGRSDSQLWIGVCYYWGREISDYRKNSFEWFSKSADQGNSYGQWRVGWCYYDGRGVAEDLAKAVKWYHKSAKQGNRYGQYDLGDCYQNGYGVPKNIDKAVFWYRKSAEQGFDLAINNLKKLGKRGGPDPQGPSKCQIQ
ncbi:uncharacterized protein BJ171DRAFT_599301 [Polychytrium aggregatum]|uniref:uncharacterized protein n=1 Tax=Polychytrium aggregatum TaxID=110093 RepID=UPI0022FF4581|nr:uncharacterized protein BJ171DRAFT_599301 [Polychytrium aggregatum]KAI9204516.1 hypothetical protein BJ171DRAFT_599301 [Polychytrium aggregatum]